MGFFMGFYGILRPWEYSFPLWFFLYFHPGISEFRSLYTLGFSKLHPVTPWVYKIPIMGIRDSSSAVIPTLVFSPPSLSITSLSLHMHRKKFCVPINGINTGNSAIPGSKPINGNVVQNRVWVFSWDFMGSSDLGNIAFHYGFFCISILVFPNSVHCTPWDSPNYTL